MKLFATSTVSQESNLAFTRWLTDIAGKIFRLRVLNDYFVILNDPKVAEDLVCEFCTLTVTSLTYMATT